PERLVGRTPPQCAPLTDSHIMQTPILRAVARKDIEIPSPEADALVRAAVDGDADAFADLFSVTLPSVYRYLYGRCGEASLAEDLAQDAYIRAMRAVRTSFTGGSSEFLAWMIRIARNRFLDHVKSGRMR